MTEPAPQQLPRVRWVKNHRGRNLPSARPLASPHPHHVLSLLLRGMGRYGLGRTEVFLKAPTLSVLVSGQEDRNELAGFYESWFVLFDWPGLWADETGAVLACGPLGPVRLPLWRPVTAEEAAQAVACFRNLSVEARRPDPPEPFAATSELMKLFALLCRGGAFCGRPLPEPGLDLFRRLLEQYACASEVSIAALAERVGMNADHLTECFHAATGVTPVAYRTRLRLRRARELLLTTALTIAEVAREVGWPESGYFARVFRRQTGYSPGAFRRRLGSP